MKKYIFAICMIILGGFLVWSYFSTKDSWEGVKDIKDMTSREVTLTCTTDMATEFHIHPELVIMMNGQEVLVPQDLGVTPKCMTAIHTHKEKNVLHVEAPVQKDFTLGDFFAVWQKDFSKSKLLEYTADDTSLIIVTVNGQKVDTYENTILRDKDKIVISYQKK